MCSRTRSGSSRDVDAGDQRAAGARAQQAAQHADDGRFAGAVRPEEAHDLAAPDAKADVIDRDEGAEALDQIFGEICGSASSTCRSLRLLRRLRAEPRTHPRCSARRPQYQRRERPPAATRRAIAGSARRHRRRRRERRRRPEWRMLTPSSAAMADRASRAGGRRNDDKRARHALLERRRRVAIEHATAMQQRQAVAALGLVEIGGAR